MGDTYSQQKGKAFKHQLHIWAILAFILLAITFWPVFDALAADSSVFKNLIANDAKGTALMSIDSDAPASSFKASFREVCGHVDTYTILREKIENRPIYKPIISTLELCGEPDNSTAKKQCRNESYNSYIQAGTEELRTWIPVSADLKAGNYMLNAKPIIGRCNNGWGYSIDWIPEIGGEKQERWAWWNATYSFRKLINCSLVINGNQIAINGSSGIKIGTGGTTQIIWTRCQPELYLYYNSEKDYIVANDTIQPFEVESGNVSSYQPFNVWQPEYLGVWHMSETTGTNVYDSAGGNNNGSTNASVTANGYFGYGRNISTAAQCIEINKLADFYGFYNFTLQSWMKMSELNPGEFYEFFSTSSASYGVALRLHHSGANNIFAPQMDALGSVAGGGLTGQYLTTWGSWYHYDMSYFQGADNAQSNTSFYVNGTHYNQSNGNGAVRRGIMNSAYHLRLGCKAVDAGGSKTDIKAVLDENRWANISLSGAAINQQQLNSNRTPGYGVLQAEENAAILIFDSQTPPDINTVNIFARILNITYNQSGYIGGSAILKYKSNRTDSDTVFIVNGTNTTGWQQISCSNSTKPSCLLNDNDIYFANYLYNEKIIEQTPHQNFTITGPNGLMQIEYYSLETGLLQNFLEIMLKTESGTTNIYYCNSSYQNDSISSTPFCALIAQDTAATPINHTHPPYIRHKIFALPLNDARTKINGIGISPGYGSFVLKSSAGGKAQIGYIDNITRKATAWSSNNSGAGWVQQWITPDIHTHQYPNTTRLWYQLCMNQTAAPGVQDCSDFRYDILEVGGILPAMPVLYAPSGVYTQYTTATAQWTSAYSANNYTISAYTLKLYDPLFNYLELIAELPPSISYAVNLSYAPGNYTFGLTANDSIGQESESSFSDLISIIPECYPDWICTAYGVCGPQDKKNCTEVFDLMLCGVAYEGNFSEINDDPFRAYVVDNTADSVYVYLNDSALSDTPLSFGDLEGPANTGIRWNNINISPGAVIDSAYVIFTAWDDTFNPGAYILISSETALNPDGYTSFADFMGRGISTLKIDYEPEQFFNGLEYQSPELKTLIQEIVNRPGWVNGNSIALRFSDNNSLPFGFRFAYSYAQDPNLAPRLMIKTIDVNCDYCMPFFSCGNYSDQCTNISYRIMRCSNAADNNSCYAQTHLTSDMYNGSLTIWDTSCSTAAMGLDIKTTSGTLLFMALLFIWLALLITGMVFKNYGLVMFAALFGIVISLLLLQVHFVLCAIMAFGNVFLLFSRPH